MRFCEKCNNMLYIKVNSTNVLQYNCKNCNNVTNHDQDEKQSICVLESSYTEDIATYKQFMTPYIKYDVTLPRVNNITCPNPQCPKDKEKEVIYIKYNHMNMKYLYFCCGCDNFWTS